MIKALLAAAVAALSSAAVAQAQVTVVPATLIAGDDAVIALQVPNELPNASTTKVDVKFPPGFVSVAYQPPAGWKASVVYRKLAKPVTVDGEQMTQEVDRITFSGGNVPPGQFVQFPLSVAVPPKPATLTFKAVQTYSNGKVVRWIGTPGSDTPAPQVTVRAAGAGDVTRAAATIPKDEDSTSGLALGFGIAGLIAGLVAIGLTARRRA
jgi:uncharacterized protein YcnI